MFTPTRPSFRNPKLLAAAAVMLAAGSAAAFPAPSSYSTGFEDFTLGPISPSITTAQNGWSGGAQGGFTNNNAGDEQITNAVVHGGSQSWLLAGGYNSPGQGTPYTPNVGPAVASDGDQFNATLWFKAAGSAGDGSSIAIETGTSDGTDRGDYLAFLSNEAGGIRLFSFNNGANFDEVQLFSNVSVTAWHKLDITLTKTGYVDAVSVSLDGGSPVSYNAALNEWRQSNSFAYADSSRLKFRPRTNDPVNMQGFYIDDINYSVGAVPEPGTISLLAITGLAALRRRRIA